MAILSDLTLMLTGRHNNVIAPESRDHIYTFHLINLWSNVLDLPTNFIMAQRNV